MWEYLLSLFPFGYFVGGGSISSFQVCEWIKQVEKELGLLVFPYLSLPRYTEELTYLPFVIFTFCYIQCLLSWSHIHYLIPSRIECISLAKALPESNAEKDSQSVRSSVYDDHDTRECPCVWRTYVTVPMLSSNSSENPSI